MIEQGGDLTQWTQASTTDYRKRKEVIEALKNTLLSPVPKKKKVKPQFYPKSPWVVGEIFTFQFNKKANKELQEKWVALHVVSVNTWHDIDEVIPDSHQVYFCFFDWVGNKPPILDELLGANYLEYFKQEGQIVPCIEEISALINWKLTSFK